MCAVATKWTIITTKMKYPQLVTDRSHQYSSANLMKPLYPFLLLVALSCSACSGEGDRWDNSKYIHVADVKPGMVGYGLSVFSGSRIDKFDVKVVSIVSNLVSPKCDVILISYSTDQQKQPGPVEGMSGSPVYLYDLDDTQHLHPRLAGAYAFGFEWQSASVVGVQPIEYMLKIPDPVAAQDGNISENPNGKAHWSLADVPGLPGMTRNGAGFTVPSVARVPNNGVKLLATPMMVTGLRPAVVKEFGPMFAAAGLDLQEGGASAATRGSEEIKMEPGSVLVAPLLIGDTEASASGTCTLVLGNRVYAFGHEFNNEGPISLPMGNGTVATLIENLHSNFKLATMSNLCGTLTNDQTVGVAGILGAPPAMAPIKLHIHYADGSLDQNYSFSAAIHPTFTPLATAMAVATSITGVKNLPEYHTLRYDLKLEFADGRTVRVADRDANSEVGAVGQGVALPILAAYSNPFKKIALKQITGDIVVDSEARLARINSVTLPKLKYEPGVKVKAFVQSRLWHGGEETMPIEFELPRDLPDGQYKLVVSDAQRYFSDEMESEPFRFTAQNIDEMFDVIDDFEALRQDSIYVRLTRQPDGVAVGRTAMQRLPPSFRTAMLGSGRSDLTAFVSSSVQVIPENLVVEGAAEFNLKIERQVHLESPRSGKATTQP